MTDLRKLGIGTGFYVYTPRMIWIRVRNFAAR
jgi:hypothetical protein